MLLYRFLVFAAFSAFVSAQSSTIVKKDVFLVRKKRYLQFPMNSNLVLTMSLTKPLMVAVPKGYAVLMECDVPFLLPSDTSLLKRYKRNHHVDKRQVLDSLEAAFSRSGLNGTVCVQRILCDVKKYLSFNNEGGSMMRDLLSAIFTWSDLDLDEKYRNACQSEADCPIPFLEYVLGSLWQT